MAERKGITKSTRFEVFKRDKFKCQYCGRTAPDVILEVDHILPVAEGGGNDLFNLITSCRDCNRGKGKKKLDDESSIKKKTEELALMAVRKEQMEMMLEWKKELISFKDETASIVINYVNKNAVQEEFEEGTFDFNLMTPEEIEIIKQAQEVLARHEREEKAKAQAAEEDDFVVKEEVVEETAEKPEVEEDYKDTINVLRNEFINPQSPEAAPVEVMSEPEMVEALKEEPVEEKKPATADDILKALASVKESQANVKDEKAPKQKIVMKIEKNAPTTKKATASGGKPKIVDVDVESMAKKPEKPAEPKAAKPKKAHGGFIGGAGGVLGLAEDNQKKSASSKTDK